MPNSLSRATFVGGSAATLGFAFAGAGSLDPFMSSAAAATRTSAGYGPLSPAGPLLALPKGFSYKVIGQSGVAGAGGFVHPGDPDAMGCFARPGGGSVVVSNHELAGSDQPSRSRTSTAWSTTPAASAAPRRSCSTPTTTCVEQYASVAGTWNNCAGGVDALGHLADLRGDRGTGGRRPHQGPRLRLRGRPHQPGRQPAGPRSRSSSSAGTPTRRWPSTRPPARIYLTEDASGPNGLYYRWTPPAGFTAGKGALHALAADGAVDVGTLEAMKCFDEDGKHVARPLARHRGQHGLHRRVGDVPDRDARTVSVRKQFTDGQVTRRRKLEGQWWGDGGAYFVASFARHADGSVNEHDGQVWFYDPREVAHHAQDDLRRQPRPGHRRRNFDGPDNITVSPYGGLILAEDGEGRSHLVGVTEQGKAYPLALQPAERQRVRRAGVQRLRAARCSPTSRRPGTRWPSPARGAGPRTPAGRWTAERWAGRSGQ